MATPNRKPLNVTLPVNLTGKLVRDIADRVETIKPIENSEDSAPVHVIIGNKNGGLGTEIKGNMTLYKVGVCVNGRLIPMYLYGKPGQEAPS